MPATKAVEERRAASSRPVWAAQQDLLWNASKASKAFAIRCGLKDLLLIVVRTR